MTTADRIPPEPGPDADVDDIQADIEQTRRQLGETVEALSAKLDVKGQAKAKATETKARVVDKTREAKEQILEKAQSVRSEGPSQIPVAAIAVAAAAAIVGVVIWRRHRR
jgi:hypothetical protein